MKETQKDIDSYIKAFNGLLSGRGFRSRIAESDLHFFNEFVTDATTASRSFSSEFGPEISPPLHDGEFYHYTSRVGAESILRTRTLWLTSILKRINEDEIKGFLKTFGFDYPLSIDPGTHKPRYLSSIGPDIFYTSFVDVELLPKDEEYFWTTFAKSDGARLKFRLEVKSALLRRMVYGTAINMHAEFFKAIAKLTKDRLKKTFFWQDCAVFCALHLPSAYKIEKEVRLIARRGCGLKPGKNGGNETLILPFGQNDDLNITLKLLEIQTNEQVRNSGGVSVIPRTHLP